MNQKALILGLPILFLLTLGWLAFTRDLGFYAPRKGKVAAGAALTGGVLDDRDLIELTITEELCGEKGYTTIEELTSWFALEQSTIACTIQKTDALNTQGDPATRDRQAKKKRNPGELIIICLNN